MRLTFARHGQSEANVLRIISNRDLPHALTELGRTQAAQLAERLSDANITHIYTSPILRARQTAEIVAHTIGCDVEVADELREFDCGISEGRGDAEAWRLHDAIVHAWRDEHDYAARIDGGESYIDMRKRFVALVNKLGTRHADETVLCISHGSVLGLMLPEVLDNVSHAWAASHSIGNCSPIDVEHIDGKYVCMMWCGAPITR